MILTDENFEKEVVGSDKPVLVYFSLKGCGPCVTVSPILEKLAREFSDNFLFAKVDFDDAPVIIQKLGITGAPTVILFNGGEAIGGFVGSKEEEEIRRWIKENLLILEYEKHAKENNISLARNRKTRDTIIKGLIEKEDKLGYKYCPCRRVSGNLEDDKNIICPCVYHLDEIKKDGRCLCGLFEEDSKKEDNENS